MFNLHNFQKSTKKLKFMALLKCFFNFVPRGTNVENFFRVLFFDFFCGMGYNVC